MNFVMIEKDYIRQLSVTKWNNEQIALLGFYLVHSITSMMGYNMFISWLQGTAHQDCYSASSYAYGLIRHKNGRIYVYDVHDPKSKRYLSFNTTADNMLKIIEDWMFVRFGCGEPESIKIIEKNEIVKFFLKIEGSDQPFI